VLGELEPLLGVQQSASAEYSRKRPELIAAAETKAFYADQFRMSDGSVTFLNSRRLYSELGGVQTNLYKNFIVRAWGLLGSDGVCGLLHPEGIYDDPNGGLLRKEMYRRLRCHFQFQNQLMLFEIGHREKFSINVYGYDSELPMFISISNLFHPTTTTKCLTHNGDGICYGIKNNDGKWNIAGHKNRIINVNIQVLNLYAKLYDRPGTSGLQARLASIHTLDLIPILIKISLSKNRLNSIASDYDSTEMWHETNDVKNGILSRKFNIC